MKNLKFEWDEAKRKVNLEKHHIDFVDVKPFFKTPHLKWVDERKEYHETRYIALGKLKTFHIVVVFTLRKNGVIRLISARPANMKEKQRYENIYG